MEKWTEKSYAEFQKELYAQGEAGYKAFHEKLLCSELTVVGIRVPILRKMAAGIAKEDGIGFLRYCGRETYEERLLYGLVAAALPVSYADFLPYCDTYTEELVENWACCDVFCSAVKKKIKGQEREFFEHIGRYLEAENPWVVRVGLIMMLSHYLTEEYLAEVLKRTDAVSSEHYYVRMAQAWLLATAWAKDRERLRVYLTEHHLDKWTFRKFIQKCCESNRISQEDKAFLRGLK